MKITVAIPTIGRPSLLHALRSILGQTRQPDRIIVVNQGDPAIRAEAAALAPDMVFVQSEERGLSRARNTALEHFDQDWIYWIDDDEEAMPGNLALIERLAATGVDLIGGGYEPPLDMPEGLRCDVLRPTQDSMIDGTTWMTSVDGVPLDCWGGNVAHSRRLIERVGGFDPYLGAGTDRFPRGEDTDYHARAVTAGFTGILSKDMPILHTFGARSVSGDERRHAALTGAVLQWKARQDASVIAPEVAERVRPYGQKKAAIARATAGLAFGEEAEIKRLVERTWAELDAKFRLEDGCLAERS